MSYVACVNSDNNMSYKIEDVLKLNKKRCVYSSHLVIEFGISLESQGYMDMQSIEKSAEFRLKY